MTRSVEAPSSLAASASAAANAASLLTSSTTAGQISALSSATSSSIRRAAGRRGWDDGIPPILRPLVRAYLLGYASAVGPRLLTLLLQQVMRRKQKGNDDGPTQKSFADSLLHVLRGGLDWQRFPTFCAVLVGGSTLLEVPFKVAFGRLAENLSEVSRQRLSRWFASFIAAWLSIKLLQSKHSDGFTETITPTSDDKDQSRPAPPKRTVRYGGRTLDLTLFAVTRALDVIGGELWSRRPQRSSTAAAAQKKTFTALLESAISNLTDPAIFALSSGLIMWTWIYQPSRLPRAYNKWIGSAAAVDSRLIEALRRCRSGELRYAEETGQAPLLGAMCKDYGWPVEWGDPAKSVPFPCEMVHMGSSEGYPASCKCEVHALSRFLRSFKWAMATYLPLNLLLAIRSPNVKGVSRALVSAARSSAFLGAFISLFYYGVCLARTRVGPLILGKHAQARQAIDGGYCVGSGCLLCGWSIMLENPGRRKDMALFVAPRALATLLPRRYDASKEWRETAVFAFSTAVVFTCMLENRKRVRGVLGSVLGSVLTA